MQNQPKEIIIHCTDCSYRSIPDQFVACNGWHRDRDFPVSSKGLFIGYHRLITGGKNYLCREDNEVGSHCNQQVDGLSMNYQSLGIAVGFDGDIEFPIPQDYELLQKQIWLWQDKYAIPPSKIRYHRFYSKDKTCPGSLITDQWLADILKRPLPVHETKTTNLCSDEVVKKAGLWDNFISFINNLKK